MKKETKSSDTRQISISKTATPTTSTTPTNKSTIPVTPKRESLRTPMLDPKLAPRLISKDAPSKISAKSNGIATAKTPSHLRPKLISRVGSRGRQSKQHSKKRPASSAIEWTVKETKLQFRPIIFSFILSNWEMIPPPIVTEHRWKKYVEPNLHNVARLPSGFDQYIAAGLMNGIKIRHTTQPKNKRKST
jgi:hypothetical protein